MGGYFAKFDLGYEERENIYHYYPYRAFGGQNKIVYPTHFVTRRSIILLLPGLCDKEGNNIIIL